MLIKPDASCLIVIDMQERLVPAMQAPARTIKNTKLLISTAKRLNIPVLITEQYPKGLGHTVREIAEVAKGLPVFEKVHFACFEDPKIGEAFRNIGRPQAVIAGMEAHICVTQSAAQLMEDGYEVFVVTDATSSRTLTSEQACLDRLQAAGAGIRNHGNGGVRVAGSRRHARVQGAPSAHQVSGEPGFSWRCRGP